MTDSELPSGYGVLFALEEEDVRQLLAASERSDDDEIHTFLDEMEQAEDPEPWVCPMETMWTEIDAVMQAGKRMVFTAFFSARLAEGVLFLPSHNVPQVSEILDSISDEHLAQWMVLAGLGAGPAEFQCFTLWFEAARLHLRRAASAEAAVVFRIQPDEMDLGTEIKLL